MTMPLIRRATILALVVAMQPIGALAVAAPPSPEARAAHPYVAHVTDAARRFGIPEAWIWAVMRVESNGDARAISTAGAMGLMQIMPATWAGLRARYRLGTDPFDVRDNIMAGAAYLRAMHDRYCDPTAMLAAYNAGPGRYDEHLSRGRPLPAETVAYLAKLAPVIGGSASAQVAATPRTDPLAWRRAALFVRMASVAVDPGADPAGDNSSVADPRPDHRSPDAEPTITQSLETPADTLFVRRTGAVRPQ